MGRGPENPGESLSHLFSNFSQWGRSIFMNDNIKSFIRVLDPADNSTGGGTASAIAGSMAAALVAMVARLSLGKHGLEPDIYYNDIIGEAEQLSRKLFDGAREDAESFHDIMTARRMPKGSDEEKSARGLAVQRATIRATETPLANTESCRRVIELVGKLEGHSNTNAASDLQCAGFLAHAGLKGCLANVAINLPCIRDSGLAERIRSRAALVERLG
jgi:methenyltetrahydrofolate cyclohydrolase